MKRNNQTVDHEIADAIGRALDAEIKGEPKQWFVTRENHRGGLKLGIGMFNPGICRVADIFYHGEPREVHRASARLIVAAVKCVLRIKSPESNRGGNTAGGKSQNGNNTSRITIPIIPGRNAIVLLRQRIPLREIHHRRTSGKQHLNQILIKPRLDHAKETAPRLRVWR